jgi:hypothetical protein
MKKEKIFSVLTTLLVVVVGFIVANSLTTFREVDASGRVIPDGKAYRVKLGLRKK